MEMSLMELWGTMGLFARGIVYVLFIMSIMVVTVALRKWIQLAQAKRATLAFSPQFSEALANADYEQARQLVEEHPKSHLANAFNKVFGIISEEGIGSVDVDGIKRVIELNSLEEISKFRRGLSILATVGSTAPFVGLLGTTIGVVNAFTGMALAGSGGLAAVSAGIAEALIVTALGIAVALPGVWLFNYFLNRIDFVSLEITYATKEFVDFLLRQDRKGGKPGKVERQLVEQAAL